MVKLVAVDRLSDVARAISVALETASAYGADVHVIHVAPQSAMHFDDRVGPSAVGPHQDRVRLLHAPALSRHESTPGSTWLFESGRSSDRDW